MNNLYLIEHEFDIITICYDKTFYEINDASEVDSVINIIDENENVYVFPRCVNVNIFKQNKDDIFTVSFINNVEGGEHQLFENIKYEDVIELLEKTDDSEKIYISVFKSSDKINAKEYFGSTKNKYAEDEKKNEFSPAPSSPET